MLLASFSVNAKLWGEAKEKSLSQRMLSGPLILSFELFKMDLTGNLGSAAALQG